MKSARLVTGLAYLPRQDATLNGTIAKYAVYISLDNSNFGNPVAKGYFNNDQSLKQVFFQTTPAQYIRIVSFSESQGKGNPWSSASEINILSNAVAKDNWEISVDSAEPGFEGAKANDGDPSSYWHTEYTRNVPGFPHYYQIGPTRVLPSGADANGPVSPQVSGLSYIARP